MMRRLKANKLPLKGLVPANFRQQKEVFLEKCMSSKVVLYDSDSVELTENDTSMLALLHRRMASEGCDVSILKGKYLQSALLLFIILIILEGVEL